MINEIKETYRKRVDFHRSEKAMTLRIRAICRRLVSADFEHLPEEKRLKAIKDDADKLYKALGTLKHPQAAYAAEYLAPLLAARKSLEDERKAAEKMLSKLAKQLPVWEWVEDVRGVGPLALGQIIGEAGDLGNYANPAKLWKRMGLAVINGGRQRKVAGAEALDHGYSPERRSVMYVIGDAVIKCGGTYAYITDRRSGL